jgi:hypothetical protein
MLRAMKKRFAGREGKPAEREKPATGRVDGMTLRQNLWKQPWSTLSV